jgi:hypothetical protein
MEGWRWHMHVDVVFSIPGRALTVAATLAVLQLVEAWGRVILAQCVGGMACLATDAFIAVRLGFKIRRRV